MRDDASGTCFIPPVVVLAMADLDEALVIFEDALAEARRRGSTLAFAAAKVFRLLVLVCGEAIWARRKPRLERRSPSARAWGSDGSFLRARFGLSRRRADGAGQARRRRGRPRRASSFASPVSTASASSFSATAAPGCASFAAIWPEAPSSSSRPVAASIDVGSRNPAFIAWRSPAAVALLQLGKRDEARRLATEELELARTWGAPRALGGALRVAGLVEGGADAARPVRGSGRVLERVACQARACEGAHRAGRCAAAGKSPCRGARAPQAGGRAGDDLRRRVTR